MEKITAQLAQVKMEKEKVCFVDVRSRDEYKSGHPMGSICIPLDEIQNDSSKIPKDKLVILSCQSGKRSAQALDLLKSSGFTKILDMEGGFTAWSSAGLPVNKLSNTIPIMRQVLITAGTLVLAGSLFTIFIDFRFIALPLFVASGLIFAGATGWCGMAIILERMPWNRS